MRHRSAPALLISVAAGALLLSPIAPAFAEDPTPTATGEATPPQPSESSTPSAPTTPGPTETPTPTPTSSGTTTPSPSGTPTPTPTPSATPKPTPTPQPSRTVTAAGYLTSAVSGTRTASGGGGTVTIPAGTRVSASQTGTARAKVSDGRTTLYAITLPAVRGVAVKAGGGGYVRAKLGLLADSTPSAKVTVTVPAAGRLTKLATRGSWVQLRYQASPTRSVTGWALASQLAGSRPSTKASGQRWTRSTLGVTSDTDGRKAAFTISASDLVTVLSRSGEWTHLRHGKRTGFVPTRSLYTSIALKGTPGQARFAKKTIPVRKDPRTSPYAASYGKVPAGAKVKLVGTSGAWSKISYGKWTGYVKSSSDLTTVNYNSVVVYGTLRKGQRNHAAMAGQSQRLLSLSLPQYRLMQYGSTNLTFTLPASKTVKVEQYVYSPSRARRLLPRLDAIEATARYGGKGMYRRTLVTLADGTRSWSYVTSAAATEVVKSRGREVPGGDFTKRRPW